MVLLRNLYLGIFRRSSTFAVAVVVSAIAFETTLNNGAEALYRALNKGVGTRFLLPVLVYFNMYMSLLTNRLHRYRYSGLFVERY